MPSIYTRNLGEGLEDAQALDHVARPVHRAVSAALPRRPSVVRGPATATQPAYELRPSGGRVEGRRRPPP